VHGPKSQELYHDYKHPQKFAGVLPVLHKLSPDDIIYGVPRRYRSLARVVDTAKLEALGAIQGNGTRVSLQPYVDVLEHGPEASTETRWEGTDILHVKAPVRSGQSVIVQISYDKPWRAWSGNAPVPVREGPLGFIRLDAEPGTEHIRLEFTTPVENIAGRVVTALTVLILLALLRGKRFRQSPER
jgi:hypothetical protein